MIAQAESPGPVSISVAEGGVFPLVSTTSGQLLLAYMEPGRRAELLQGDSEYRRMTESQRQRLARWLEAIREAGCLKQASQITRGVSDFSVLVGLPEKEPVAALTVACMDDAMPGLMRNSRLLRLMRSCVREINLATGVF